MCVRGIYIVMSDKNVGRRTKQAGDRLMESSTGTINLHVRDSLLLSRGVNFASGLPMRTRLCNVCHPDVFITCYSLNETKGELRIPAVILP